MKAGERGTTLQQQHTEILQLTDILSRPGHRDSKRDTLTRLTSLLSRHFELEEEGGYFVEELALAPQLSDTAERLRKDHARLEERVEQMGHAARGESTADALERDIGRLVQELRDHEAAENRLVQAAFLEDHGGG